MGGTINRKLVIEICNAKNLMPKDGQGTSSAYVLVDYDGQRRRTKTISRDLNPQWDEKVEFVVHDIASMGSETLELNVYNDKKSGKRSTFLGKVKISGNIFPKSGSETLVYYPLEKRSVFSQIKGEIGLKMCYIDEIVPAPAPAATAEKSEAGETITTVTTSEVKAEDKKEEEKRKRNQRRKPKRRKMKRQMRRKRMTRNPKKQINLNNRRRNSLSNSSDRNHRNSAYDLVDRMPFLYVRVLKAKHSETGSSIYAKLVIGTHSIRTKTVDMGKDWDQVFAFDKDSLNSTVLEVSVWTEKLKNSVGNVSFDLQEVPKRVPPDSPLAPQWYTLEGSTTPDNALSGSDVMLAVWVGTQADEAFQEAWQSDSGGLLPETRAKVYLSPKLWYLRLTVIQTQDLQHGAVAEAKGRSPELYVKAQLGAQIFKTGRCSISSSSSANPTWNEDLVFVAAEPFEPFLVMSVEDASAGNLLAMPKYMPYAGRIHVRICLEGGYHVLDEAAHVTSDVPCAAAKQLSKPPIGLLEVGIRGAANLLPVKTKDGPRGTTDAYVVAKYGPKWVRTRTILDRFNPRWNEQYTWDVYDPCTVLTIGVFDNGRYKKDEAGKPGKDARIGKIRIRLATLDTNRIYMNSYALTVIHPSGAKKMGEIELAVRFSCSSLMNILQVYTNPMLPRMHYVKPLGPAQQDILRHTAMRIVLTRLARSEPPMGQEVVQYMIDTDSHVWSMRRSKANWFRVVGCLSRAASFARWLDGIRTWINPSTTVLVHLLLVAIILCPHLVLPTHFSCMHSSS
ncbi:hypothetical protein MKW92_008717 [Papaver armeniacum]|nr:hypothetical protein MKW92_008717 [Papaver armeniacum]